VSEEVRIGGAKSDVNSEEEGFKGLIEASRGGGMWGK
jgi:hypothetical protein